MNLDELVERVKGRTPEPWTVAHDADGDYTILAGSTILAITWDDTERAKANGEIMRAAPSLLTLAVELRENLKHAVSCMDRSCQRCNKLQEEL